MTTIQAAWRAGRATRSRTARSTPVLLALIAYAARKLPAWRKARTAIMQWSAFGAIDAGLFGWHWIAGAIGIGVSLLILEALGGERA